MKALKKMNKLLGLSMVLMVIASCGSDNKVEVSNADNTSSTSESTATTESGVDSCQAASDFSDFRNRVANMNFIKESYTRANYYFYTCDEKEGWFGINYSKCKVQKTVRYENRDLGRVNHEYGTSKAEIRDRLLTIIDEAVDVQGNGTYYEIESPNGEVRGISLCHTLVGNPIFWQSADDKQAYQYAYKTNY